MLKILYYCGIIVLRETRMEKNIILHISEYDVENKFIDRLESIGYQFVQLDNYDGVLANFRMQLATFNAKVLNAVVHAVSFSDAEFQRIMIYVKISLICTRN